MAGLARSILTCGSFPQMSPYDNLLLCQPVSSPLPLRYAPKWGVGPLMTRGTIGGMSQSGTAVETFAAWPRWARVGLPSLRGDPLLLSRPTVVLASCSCCRTWAPNWLSPCCWPCSRSTSCWCTRCGQICSPVSVRPWSR